MSSQIKICLCPFEPNIAIAEGLVISVSPPYTTDKVTVTINPYVTDYIEGKTEGDIRIAQLIEHRTSDETITTKLDIQHHPEQLFAHGGKLYSIRFMGTSKELREGQEFLSFEFFIDVLELTDVQKESSMTFTLSHEHNDWMTNKNAYKFKPLSIEGVFIQPFKDPDCTFRISINGPLGHSLTLRQNISGITTPKLHVALTWKDSSVKLYLNGELAKEESVEENLA
uniref:Uncharacterized protein n=1 Tax=uncultured microorganism TaxID=358574 RepID=K0J8P2_9ZZZZ|nr:hypothetical protein [uncultured microorganism]